jgi:hypothetical protein
LVHALRVAVHGYPTTTELDQLTPTETIEDFLSLMRKRSDVALLPTNAVRMGISSSTERRCDHCRTAKGFNLLNHVEPSLDELIDPLVIGSAALLNQRPRRAVEEQSPL